MRAFGMWLTSIVLLLLASIPVWSQDKEEGRPPKENKPKEHKSPLDRLARTELTPVEQQELPVEAVAVIPGGGAASIRSCAFLPDGSRLAIGRQDGAIELWEVNGAKPKLQATLENSGAVAKLVFSPDGKHLASLHGVPSQQMRLWLMEEDGARAILSHKLPRIEDVAFHPGAKKLALGSLAGQVYDIGDKKLEGSSWKFGGAINNYQFTPDGKRFLAVFFQQERNGPLYGSEVMFWKVSENELVEYQKIQTGSTFKAVALSPDSNQLATGSVDNKVRVWDLTVKEPQAKELFEMPRWIRSLYFTKDGSHLVAFSSGTDITLWNLKVDKAEKNWEFKPRRGGPFGTGPMHQSFSATALAPDGRHIVFSNHTPSAVILRLPITRAKEK